MRKEDFAILHDTKTTQLLIDQDYSHLADEFSLTIKWWSVKINGFVTMSPKWKAEFEEEFFGLFEALKDVDQAIEYVNNMGEDCGIIPELEKVKIK